MNILLIGNGFDIAHGLPTKYTDFLGFCDKVIKLHEYDAMSFNIFEMSEWKGNINIENRLYKAIKERKEIPIDKEQEYATRKYSINYTYDELYSLINGNIWIDYFQEIQELQEGEEYTSDKWIDFEKEISRIIKTIDLAKKSIYDKQDLSELKPDDFTLIKLLAKLCGESVYTIFGSIKTIVDFANELYEELEAVIRALEIYISDFVEHISSDVRIKELEELDVSHVISFNYSNTYEFYYGTHKSIEYDYIHGRANLHNSIVTNNMVLGIDEYLPVELRDSNIDFIAFKKFYQRIHKATGCKYKDWIDKIIQDRVLDKEYYGSELISYDEFAIKHKLYIFGHSLDVTDKDILRDLILNDNVYTTVFYYEKKDEEGNGDNGRKDLGEKIANLVKVIGQDELIRRTGGSTKTIEFKLQSSTTNSEV